MDDSDKLIIWLLLLLFSPLILLVLFLSIHESTKSARHHEIILECIKQGEIHNNPICSQYLKK